MSEFLLSDVQTLVEQTVNGQTVRVPTIFNDVGQATLSLVLKDQGTVARGADRAERRDAESLSHRLPAGGWPQHARRGRAVPGRRRRDRDGRRLAPSPVAFEMVRHQAKLEQPLRSLANFGGRLFITTIAEVTFYGSDLAGNDVQATGTINVSFSDYADPE